MRVHRIAALLALAVSSAAQGQVHLVDPATPGAFTSVQAAVDAAASGDTVLVRPRSGGYGCVLVDGKGLTLVGDPAGAVVLCGLTVRNLAASQTAALLHLELPETILQLASNAGRVWIEDCHQDFYFDTGTAGPFPGLAVDDCASVIVLRSSFRGGTDSDRGGAGLRVRGASTVHAYDSTFLGGFGDCVSSFGILQCWDGGPGIVAESGQVSLTSSTARGGDGIYYVQHFSSDCTAGGAGVMGAVTARVSVVQGGAGGVNGAVQCAPDGPDVVGTLTELPGERLGFTTGPLAREGEDVVFSFRGTPGAEVWLMGSPSARLEERPAQHGWRLLGTPRAVEHMGTLDASGALDVLVPLGLLAPGFDVRRTFLQPFMVTGARPGPLGKLRAVPSRVTLGAGSAFLVLDNTF